MNTTNRLHIRNLSFSYSDKEILKNITIDIESGRLTSIQGRNGTGKSTLLKCIAGLSKPTQGEISLNNISLQSLTPLERSRQLAALWTDRLRIAGFTIYDLVLMGTYNAQKESNSHELDSIVTSCLSALGIEHLSQRSLDQVSDGELQKAMIARALAQQPAFLLLDEPTTYLDYVAKEELMLTLQKLSSLKGIGIVFTSHELELIRTYAHTRLEIADATISQLK
jgi:iron complex transport system ATP-binding protein